MLRMTNVTIDWEWSMSYRKPYDDELNLSVHEFSIAAMTKWVAKMGCTNAADETAANRFGFDRSFIDTQNVKIYCELALRYNWRDGSKPFPFATIHVEERKGRFLVQDPYRNLSWIYMVVRKDGAGVSVLLNPAEVLPLSPIIIQKHNRFCDDPNGEGFYDVKTSYFEYFRL